MTYCVAIRVNQGLVFLSDSRTNAGVDQIGTFRKMYVIQDELKRFMVLMASGNLSITQSILHLIPRYINAEDKSIWDTNSMFESAQIIGDIIRIVHEKNAQSLENLGIEFNVNLIFGGQINDEHCRLFQIYPAGNFIESFDESLYFQIGESKYGKPIIDRVITKNTSLGDAAKCALISMDSTIRSNISVGFPLDLMIYDSESFKLKKFITIDEKNIYFQMIRNTWGKQLNSVFEEIENPIWDASEDISKNVLSRSTDQSAPIFLYRLKK